MNLTIYCGRCGRKEKKNEKFDYHYRKGVVDIPTHLCPKCEDSWHDKLPYLYMKQDEAWKEAFEEFMNDGKMVRERVTFT